MCYFANIMKKGIVIPLLMLVTSVFSQKKEDKKWSGHGYVKYMTIESISHDGNTINQNFIHNRYNFRYDIKPNLTAKIELRNRLFYGEFLKFSPTFADQLGIDRGYVDMSWNLIANKNVILHSTVDRAWLNWTNDKWDVGLGRQRINWGVNLVWNPNDLFNVLNFTDFDYEERPGSDAFRAQRFFKDGMSKVELAYKHTGNLRTTVVAGMYKFNKNLYDIQIIAGKYQTDAVLGLGWAGSIKNAGFKGEVTYFEPVYQNPINKNRAVSATTSVDYSFRKGLYVMGSFLYNTVQSGQVSQLVALGNTTGNPLSARQLMPNEYSVFVQFSESINPLIGASFASIYAIDINAFLLFPTISYSMTQNMELSFVAQSFLAMKGAIKGHVGSGLFLRFKYSY